MDKQKLAWRINAAQRGVRLDHFLASGLAKAFKHEIPRSLACRIIESGAVSRDGLRERLASSKLATGMLIEVNVDPTTLDSTGLAPASGVGNQEFSWTPRRVLFEDEWLLAVDKPAGLPTHPTLDQRRTSVFSTLQAFLGQRDGGTPYLGLHHRLDRDTTGVLLLTKHQKANAGTAALFSGKTLQKSYHALAVYGAPVPDTWEVENHLGVVGRVQKASRFGAVCSGGDPARTSFRVLERLPGALLVEARPHTGRTHQIRVHLAEGGHAIVGDSFYGGPAHLTAGPAGGRVAAPRVMLHAASLEFLHPITHVALKISSARPADFEGCLQALRSGAQRKPSAER